ncbi:MAG: 1-acyl-sn-glycerol-3-phosphate acyltransferase [Fibrobacterales bacterium]
MTTLEIIHILKKSIFFVLFGIGSFLLYLLVLLPFSFIISNQVTYQRISRYAVSKTFSLFIKILEWTRVISLDVKNIEKLQSNEPLLICANHPTLLDVVVLISMIPNANCIVKASLWGNPLLRRIVSRLYISNALEPTEILAACKETIEKGNQIIIFPEGTRTDCSNEQVLYKRSAAHLSLSIGCTILPVYINTPSPSGIGKNDNFFSSPKEGIIRYTISIKDKLPNCNYNNLARPLAARKITNDLVLATFE